MTLLSTAATYRAHLAQHEAHAAHQIEAAHHATVQACQPSLSALYDEITAEMDRLQAAHEQEQDDDKAAALILIPLSWLYAHGRLPSLLATITSHVNGFASVAQGIIEQAQQYASRLATQGASALLAQVMTPAEHLAANVAQTVTQASGKVAKLVAGMGEEAASKVRAALVRGISLGSTVKRIAQDVSQALDVSRWRAQTVASTELYQTYKSGVLDVFRANDSVIEGWIWVCSLSRSSCCACVAMHGTKHSLDEELQDHPCGGCQAVPYTADTPDIQSGAEWFDAQDAGIQRDILGSQLAYDTWKHNDDVNLSDFVAVHHDAEHGSSIYQKSVKQLTKGK